MTEAATEIRSGAEDIAARLESAFARIHVERMYDVPILNQCLKVEAVGMRAWQGDWLCVLITTWFINLMLLPATEERAGAWGDVSLGSSQAHSFPAGRFDFLVGQEEGIGRYQMCSLFSPVLEFEDQNAARLTAAAALEALFDAGLDERRSGEPQKAAVATAPSGVSRRGLLRGKLVAEQEPT